MSITFDDWLALTQLYADYAIAVDSGQWDLWPEFFTDDCVYRLQPRENFERGFPLATLSFTSKGMLKDRVYGITQTIYHGPYYTRHVFSPAQVLSHEADRIRAQTHYAVFRTRPGDAEAFSGPKDAERGQHHPDSKLERVFRNLRQRTVHGKADASDQ